MFVECFAHLRIGRIIVVREQCRRADLYAGEAIAALTGLKLNQRALQGVRGGGASIRSAMCFIA